MLPFISKEVLVVLYFEISEPIVHAIPPSRMTKMPGAVLPGLFRVDVSVSAKAVSKITPIKPSNRPNRIILLLK